MRLRLALGVEVKAVVVTNASASITPVGLIARCKVRLVVCKCARIFGVAVALPMTATRMILQRAMPG